MLNLDAIRAQFPALQQIVNGNPLVYLDSAATTTASTMPMYIAVATV